MIEAFDFTSAVVPALSAGVISSSPMQSFFNIGQIITEQVADGVIAMLDADSDVAFFIDIEQYFPCLTVCDAICEELIKLAQISGV